MLFTKVNKEHQGFSISNSKAHEVYDKIPKKKVYLDLYRVYNKISLPHSEEIYRKAYMKFTGL